MDCKAGRVHSEDSSSSDDKVKQTNGRSSKKFSASTLSRMPRLIYYETTAETVNAVQALVTAGEAEAGNCCALIDKQEGVHFLESVLRRKPGLQARRAEEQRMKEMKAEMNDMVYQEVHAMTKGDKKRQEKAKRRRRDLASEIHDRATAASDETNPSTRLRAKHKPDGGEDEVHQASSADSLELLKESWTSDRLHIICSSVIYDDLFRQVRQGSRGKFCVGYSKS